MARRVIIRSRHLLTDVAQLEEMLKNDLRDIRIEHFEDLEEIAEQIEADAGYLVPESTGKLTDSISVRVSRSNRFPGIIAHASAKNKGFDYALMQEENEEYEHGEEKVNAKGVVYIEDTEKSAHYLGGPFAIAIRNWYEDVTGEELDLSEELQHAADYVEDKL